MVACAGEISSKLLLHQQPLGRLPHARSNRHRLFAASAFFFPKASQRRQRGGLLGAFGQGLKEMGWVEGQNIAFEYRSADGKEDALPSIAVGLVQMRLDAILAEGTAAIQAAKDATQSIPIVMAASNDPVASRLIATLNQPGGNVTGLSLQSSELAG